MKKILLLLTIGLSWNCGAAITTNKLLSAQSVTNYVESRLGSNFVFATWRWIDVVASGFAVGSNPGADPPILTEVPAQSYFGYAWYFADKGYFSIQGNHSIATTNASNLNVYFNPHCHVLATNISAGTNCTFVLDLYYGKVWNYLTNYITKTNSCTFTNIYRHGILDFGYVTNNTLSGAPSVIFKGRVMRIDGGSGDIGSASPVWVDSFDVHIPIDRFGSGQVWGD